MTVAQSEPKNTQRIELLAKLLSRALDPAAPEPEAVNSATKFAIVARRDGITYHRLSEFFLPALPPPVLVESEPPAWSVEMPFGKHRGRDMAWLARHASAYLKWVAENLQDDFLREAAQQVIEYFTSNQWEAA